MIFGGYGKKRKHRGDVIYPCVECGDALSVHGLVETYGYGRLYGVRVAKVGTQRGMICSVPSRLGTDEAAVDGSHRDVKEIEDVGADRRSRCHASGDSLATACFPTWPLRYANSSLRPRKK